MKKFRPKNKLKGQYLAEVVILLSLVFAAILGMQTYIRRGHNARMKGVVDLGVDLAQQALPDIQMSNELVPRTTPPDRDIIMQYEPYYTDEEVDSTMKQASFEKNEPYDNRGRLTSGQYSHNEIRTSTRSMFDNVSDRRW